MTKKIRVILTEDSAHAVSDWAVEAWYMNLLESDEIAYVATNVMLSELRIGVRLGEIEPFDFDFKGTLIKCTTTGELDNWPDGLFDHLLIQMDVLMLGVSRERARNMQYSQSEQNKKVTIDSTQNKEPTIEDRNSNEIAKTLH